MKYLKEFETTADYAAYSADTENFILPNISVCNDDVYKVYYNTFEKPKLIVKYNVEDDSEPTPLYFYSDGSGRTPIENYGVDIFTKAVIDGVEVSIESLDAAQGKYQLSSGEHIVEFSLNDPTTIGALTFVMCGNVTDVTIPYGVTSITSFTISEGSITQDLGPFYGCSGLTSVTIPDSVTSIGNSVAMMCQSLDSLDIPDSVTSIGEFAFFYCGFKDLRIGSGLTNLCDSSFTFLPNVSAITVDANNAVYDSRNNCNAIIETSTNKLIQGCKNTIIPNSVTSIRDGVYFSMYDVYVGAFTSLIESITIPSNVTYIGTYAFSMCSLLTSVTVEATTPPTLGEHAFDDNASGRKIYVPSASVETYKAATNWSEYADDIEAIQ
jgi:hypothetical protein